MWISVEDRLPRDHGIFLFAQKSGHVGICRYGNYRNVPWRDRFVYVHATEMGGIELLTHWQPLPEPPPDKPDE